MAAKKAQRDGGGERAKGRARAQQAKKANNGKGPSPIERAAKGLGAANAAVGAVVAANYGAAAIRQAGIAREMKAIEQATKATQKRLFSSGKYLQNVYGRVPAPGEQFPRGANPFNINQWVTHQADERTLRKLYRREVDLTRLGNKIKKYGGFTSRRVVNPPVNQRVNPPRGGRIGGRIVGGGSLGPGSMDLFK